MSLDLVGKLHRTVYIEGCPENVREDLICLLITKCGPIEGWDAVGTRLIAVFGSMNSISTAMTFNGTAFGDLTTKLFLWVATESPPAGVVQQLAITGGDGEKGGATRSAEEIKSAREARERRLAAIRTELATDIAQAEETMTREEKMRELCRRQVRALVRLTQHAVKEAETTLEERSANLHASTRLLEGLHARKSATNINSVVNERTNNTCESKNAEGTGEADSFGASYINNVKKSNDREDVTNGGMIGSLMSCDYSEGTTSAVAAVGAEPLLDIPTNTHLNEPFRGVAESVELGVAVERATDNNEVTRRVEAMVAAAEDIGRRRRHRNRDE